MQGFQSFPYLLAELLILALRNGILKIAAGAAQVAHAQVRHAPRVAVPGFAGVQAEQSGGDRHHFRESRTKPQGLGLHFQGSQVQGVHGQHFLALGQGSHPVVLFQTTLGVAGHVRPVNGGRGIDHGLRRIRAR